MNKNIVFLIWPTVCWIVIRDWIYIYVPVYVNREMHIRITIAHEEDA